MPLVAITIALIMSGCASLYDVQVGGASASLWSPKISGDVAVDLAGFIGDKIDLARELDLEDERIPEFRAYASAGSLTIEGTYFGVDYDGENTLSRSITVKGRTFTAGAPINSEFNLDYGAIKAKIGVVGAGPVAVGVVLGVGYIKVDDQLTSTSLPGVVVGKDLETAFPGVGLVATFNQSLGDTLSIFGEAEAFGLAVRTNGIDGRFVDAQARAGLGLGPLKLGVGYRVMDLNVEETRNNDSKINVRLDGPYVFGEIAF